VDPALAAGVVDPYEAHVFSAALFSRADEYAKHRPEEPDETTERHHGAMEAMKAMEGR
jgi:hypothetical protein